MTVNACDVSLDRVAPRLGVSVRGDSPSLTPDILRAMLAERAEHVVPSLLRDVRREGSELKGHTRAGRLIAVCIAGPKRGTVLDCAEPNSPRSGNLFNLILHEQAGGNLSRARRCSMALLGVKLGWQPDPEQVAAHAARRRFMAAEYARRREMARQMARRIYGDATPQSACSPSGRYLAGRGLAPMPMVLRGAMLRYPGGPCTCHAMIAPVVHPASGHLIGCHRTFLEDADGRWRKLTVAAPRLALGPVGGGVIPLARGASDLPLHAAPAGPVLVGEGIETVLSALTALPELRAFACLSVGNFAAIDLPPQFSPIVFCRERDGANASTLIARERALRRWLGEGRAVETFDPPAPFKDHNDALRGYASVAPAGQ